MVDKLLLCHLPAADLRRINPIDTPYLSALFDSYPWVKIKTLPGDDSEAVTLTGAYPHDSGIWQVKLKPESPPSLLDRIGDAMPDDLVTTFQGLVRVFNFSTSDYLCTIPSRRLRSFEIHRFKYRRVGRAIEDVLQIGSVKSVLGVIGYGPEKSNYVFNRKYDQLSGNLTRVCSGEYRLEYFEIRCLDFEQHWNLDDATKIRLFYRRIDDFIKLLHEKCTANHVTLMILSDHGQEQVKGDIDIKTGLNRLGLASNEYQYYLQATKARFWFHTDRARHSITDMLSSLRHGTVLTYQELHQYNVRFDNTDYGDVYFFPDAGFIIFPHDLYQPVANLFLGLVNGEQRSRIFNGRQKGEHGYLPYNESEYGFMMVLDQSCQASDDEVEIIDIAPSVLGLLGYDNAPTMKGRSAFVAV